MNTKTSNLQNSQTVDYYKLYKLDNKDNKDNRENGLCLRTEWQGDANASLVSGSSQVGNLSEETQSIDTSSTSYLIERCIMNLFDNGEHKFRRYKLKATMNLHGYKSKAEFIASLSKDWSNFKRHIPELDRDEVIEEARILRNYVREEFKVWPLMGKFHLKTTNAEESIQNEPRSYAIIWFNPNIEHWVGRIRIHDWHYNVEFDKDILTAKQKQVGVLGQTLYINPIHDKRQRQKTFLDMLKDGDIK